MAFLTVFVCVPQTRMACGFNFLLCLADIFHYSPSPYVTAYFVSITIDRPRKSHIVGPVRPFVTSWFVNTT